jgi:5-oxoprolinase (ATP-hydrolysing) subunit C
MITVLSPGLQTSVQDRGRHGWRALGVAQAGAADSEALWLANRLLGNAEDAAALEITLLGPRLQLARPLRIALTGARIDARLDGSPLPLDRPLALPAGELRLGRCRGGARSYLAVGGGIAVPPLLGSRATDLGAGFGGLAGRALRRGDRLRAGEARVHPAPPPPWWAAVAEDRARAGLPEEAMRLLLDPHAGIAPEQLPERVWRIGSASTRQALRLEGPPLPLAEGAAARISAPVHPGTVQRLPDGEPLVLGPDAQTCGGYPTLGWVIGADLPRLGQRRPGDALRFVAVSLAEAERANRERLAQRARLDLALSRRGG